MGSEKRPVSAKLQLAITPLRNMGSTSGFWETDWKRKPDRLQKTRWRSVEGFVSYKAWRFCISDTDVREYAVCFNISII